MTAPALRLAASPDNERLYVASVLALPELLDTPANVVDPEDLGHKDLRALLLAVRAAKADGRVTRRRVIVEAQRAGLVEAQRVVEELAQVDVETEVEPIAKALRERGVMRRAEPDVRALQQAVTRCDLEAFREIVGRLTLSHDQHSADVPVMRLREVLGRTCESLIEAANDHASGKLIRLGMPTVDAHYRISPGSMVCVGAQTNVGKSTLVWAWLSSMAGRGIPVGLVSVEDPPEDLGALALSEMAGLKRAEIWRRGLSTDEWNLASERALSKADLPVSFGYVPTRSIDAVLARMEFMARVHGCRVIAVDYLQAISHRDGPSVRERIDRTLEELISQAGRLGIGLILVSQLARPDKGNPFREPHLIDLKESGSIENRAQCVVLIWRTSDAVGEPVRAKIAKAKRAPAGARFTLVRQPDTGALMEQADSEDGWPSDEHSPDAYRASMRGAR